MRSQEGQILPTVRKRGEIIAFYSSNAIERRKTKRVKFPLKTKWMFISHQMIFNIFIYLKSLNSWVIYTYLFFCLLNDDLIFAYNLSSFSSYPLLRQHKIIYYIHFWNGKFRWFWVAFLVSVHQETWGFWNKKISWEALYNIFTCIIHVGNNCSQLPSEVIWVISVKL